MGELVDGGVPFLFLRAEFQAKFRLVFDQGKKCAVKTVKYKGFSTYGSPLKNEQRMSEEDIHHQFDDGNFKVPCSGLKFQGFDEDLEIAIRKSLGRTRLR